MNRDNVSGHLIATKLSKGFQRKGHTPIQVLKDFSLEIEPGKLTVIMGSSGCGKSTLAYILAGFIKADSGAVLMDGQPITGPGSDRILVFQETALWPWMTVIDNVMFGPLARGEQSRAEVEQTAMNLLERFGLKEFRDKYPGHLSGGMKRRVEIAQALVNHPRLMILDEPFRGLDEMTRELMQEYYLNLFEDTSLTTLFITSELEEAIFLADRILIMGGRPGQIIAEIDVNLPHPRKFEVTDSQEYLDIKRLAMDALYSVTPAEERVG